MPDHPALAYLTVAGLGAIEELAESPSARAGEAARLSAAEAAEAYAAALDRQRNSALSFELESTLPGVRVELSAIRGLTDPSLLKRRYRFQMPPMESFMRQLTHNHSDFDTLAAGQHSRSTGAALEVVTFHTLVVDYDATMAVWPNTGSSRDLAATDREEIWNVLNMTDTLEQLINSGTPFLLRAGMPGLWQGSSRAADKVGNKNRQGDWDVNMPVTLRSLQVEEKAGEPDSRYLQVEFHEYRRLDLERRTHGKSKAKTHRARELDTPAVVEVFADSSAIDRTLHNRHIASAEVQTRLSAAAHMTDGTFRSRSTKGFSASGQFVVSGHTYRYHSRDNQNFYGVTPVGAAATGRTIAAGAIVTQNPGKGLTLRMLSTLFYGSPTLWQHILTANPRLAQRRVSGGELLGVVVLALRVPSLKIKIPKPPRNVTAGGSFQSTGGVGLGPA